MKYKSERYILPSIANHTYLLTDKVLSIVRFAIAASINTKNIVLADIRLFEPLFFHLESAF